MKPDTVILELANPEVDDQLLAAKTAVTAAQSDLAAKRTDLNSKLLDEQSQLAQAKSEYETARMQAEAEKPVAEKGVIPAVQYKKSMVVLEQSKDRMAIEEQRVVEFRRNIASQLAAEQARLDQLVATRELRQRQADALHVRAGIEGILQQVPVEEGQQVAAGTNLARVARPGELMARTAHRRDAGQGRRARPAGQGRHAQRHDRRQGAARRSGRAERHRAGRCRARRQAAAGRAAGSFSRRHDRDRTAAERALRRPPRVRPVRFRSVLALAGIIVALLLGYFITALLWPAQRIGILQMAFAPAVGIGLCSMIFIAFRRPVFVVEGSLLILLALAWFVLRKPAAPSLALIARWRPHTAYILLACGLGMALSVSDYSRGTFAIW